MAVEETAEDLVVARKQYLADRDFQLMLKREEHKHELAKLQVEVGERAKREYQGTRALAVERGIVAFAKVLPIILLIPCIMVLLLAKREVPKFIQDFLSF